MRLLPRPRLLGCPLAKAAAALLGLNHRAPWNLNPRNLRLHFKTAEFDTVITTNPQGIRERRMIAPEHPGIHRIITVGSSMTFGWGVSDDETYPIFASASLRRKHQLECVEVVNVGRPGGRLPNYLRFVRQYASALRPDFIVVGFMPGHDCPARPPVTLYTPEQVQAQIRRHVADAERPRSFADTLRTWPDLPVFRRRLMEPLAPGALLRRDGAGIPGRFLGEANPLGLSRLAPEIRRLNQAEPAWERYRTLSDNGILQKGLDQELNAWRVRDAILSPFILLDGYFLAPDTLEAMQSEWAICKGLIAEIRRAAEDLGARLVILSIPSGVMVDPKCLDFTYQLGFEASNEMLATETAESLLTEACRENGIPCVATVRACRERTKAGESLYHTMDAHANAQGNRLMGEMLADALAILIKRDRAR